MKNGDFIILSWFQKGLHTFKNLIKLQNQQIVPKLDQFLSKFKTLELLSVLMID